MGFKDRDVKHRKVNNWSFFKYNSFKKKIFPFLFETNMWQKFDEGYLKVHLY